MTANRLGSLLDLGPPIFLFPGNWEVSRSSSSLEGHPEQPACVRVPVRVRADEMARGCGLGACICSDVRV